MCVCHVLGGMTVETPDRGRRALLVRVAGVEYRGWECGKRNMVGFQVLCGGGLVRWAVEGISALWW